MLIHLLSDMRTSTSTFPAEQESFCFLRAQLFEERISDKILYGTDMQHSFADYIEEIRGLQISKTFMEKILRKCEEPL